MKYFHQIHPVLLLVVVLLKPSTWVSAFVAPNTKHTSSSRIHTRHHHNDNAIFLNVLYSVEPKKQLDEVNVSNKDEEESTSNKNNDTVASAVADDILKSSSNAVEAVGENELIETTFVGGILWRGVVAILCALWASNFAAIKLITAEPGVDSSLYAVSRFSIAALSLLPFAINTIRKSGIDGDTLRGAAICGCWVSFGYLGQLLGLLTTTASRSCVICSLHCVFVALIAELTRVSNRANAKFDTSRLGPAALAVIGVAIVELQGAGGAPNIGDLLSFAQPIGFGMGYLQLEELMRRRPDAALPVSAVKLIMVALSSFFLFELGPLLNLGGDAAAVLGPRLPDFGAILASPVALGGVLYTGLVTTAIALWVESIAFARVPATDASIILTTEPLFAALFGAISLGETFGVSDYVGATLIIGACILATLMDNPGDTQCNIDEDPNCEPPRKWPFWGF